MTKPYRDANPRWPGFLLAALVAALVTLFGAGTASAATASAAQTRVGAHALVAQVLVGPGGGIGAGQRLGNDLPDYDFVLATGVAAETATAAEDAGPLIKAGAEGGETAGKAFSQGIRQSALDENPSTCVYCRMETNSPQVDHAIPRARGGNATLENAQTTCPWCNASKGARDFPVNPPAGYEGGWPPSWWSIP
jgi:HNH endonuclease